MLSRAEARRAGRGAGRCQTAAIRQVEAGVDILVVSGGGPAALRRRLDARLGAGCEAIQPCKNVPISRPAAS
jgi:hypothetical protein